jgi:hypothetical protein
MNKLTEPKKGTAEDPLFPPLAPVLLALILATGCAAPKPLKGGHAVTTPKPAGGLEQTIVQPENPSQPSGRRASGCRASRRMVPNPRILRPQNFMAERRHLSPIQSGAASPGCCHNPETLRQLVTIRNQDQTRTPRLTPHESRITNHESRNLFWISDFEFIPPRVPAALHASAAPPPHRNKKPLPIFSGGVSRVVLIEIRTCR